MPKLTPALLASKQADAKEAQSIILKGQSLTHIDDISFCVNLARLDLSNNSLSTNEALSGLQYCRSLTWLSLAHNQLDSIDNLRGLGKLAVLNVSHNRISFFSTHLAKLSNLKALIANNNEIAVLDALALPASLNTLVLSQNAIESVPSLARLKVLGKLSLSHNRLYQVDDLSSLSALKELRLNDNKLAVLPRLPASLSTLDIGSNPIERVAATPRLETLNVKGTLVDEHSIDKRRLCIFNGRKLNGKSRRPHD